ncbi:unnamed protein product, partial [Polarella glacialis]
RSGSRGLRSRGGSLETSPTLRASWASGRRLPIAAPGEKRPLLDPRTPQPARRTHGATSFAVFEDDVAPGSCEGDVDVHGAPSVSRGLRSSPPLVRPKSRSGDDPWMAVDSDMIIEEMDPSMLPEVEGFPDYPGMGMDRGQGWDALWEDGPGDPAAIAADMARTADLANLEAQRQDA